MLCSGARVKPQLPPMTVVTPCMLDGLAVGSHMQLCVVVRVGVDEARRDDAAGGVGDPLAAGSSIVADGDDPPVLDADVGDATRGAPVPSTTVPPLMISSSMLTACRWG